jgi:aspartyl-tRNA(Asn)/glutamyl-tRNA(Gln) amidotransferase subunit A
MAAGGRRFARWPEATRKETAMAGDERGVPIHAMTASALVEAYRAGTLTPPEAVDAVLLRLDAVNPAINAVIFVDRAGAADAARRSLQRWRAGRPLSALDGVPITVKDNLFVAGMKATWGSALYRDFVPDEDEPPVGRLRAAGAIVVGKTNVPEFTLQGYTSNRLFGPTRNPHALERTPGGSTGGGAAAVAAGIGPLAIGTDGGGSTRRPAAYCGLYGLKPSLGMMARWGGFPQILSDFEVVGPMARSVADVSAAFAIMRGHDPRDPRSVAAAGLPVRPGPFRIGFVPRVGDAPVDPRIAGAAAAAARSFAAMGHAVEEAAAPYDAGELAGLWSVVAESGIAWHLAKMGDWRGHVGENAVRMADAGARHSATAYVAALDGIADMRRRAGEFFSRFDAMLCPTTAALAWPADNAFPETIADRPVGPRGHAVFSAWANLVGAAGGNIPVGMTDDAGGIGVQVTAATGGDDLVLALMAAWEAGDPPYVPSIADAGLFAA